MIKALITKRKIPKVKMVMGMVSNTSKGLMTAFNRERTKATNTAVVALSIFTPGNRNEVTITASVLIINLAKKSISKDNNLVAILRKTGSE